ncbi:MAG: glycine zipper domain-containing protein [Planctomycetota bacterium]|jgi:hypothetical protein
MTRRLLDGTLVAALCAVLFTAGCETGGQTGALAGAGIGALAGQAIGGNTTATLVGAGIGTGIGFLIGNSADRQEAERMSDATSEQGFTHDQVGSLGGTRWEVIDLRPTESMPPASSRVVEFRTNGKVTTTRTNLDGTIDITDESFRVVGDMLIVNRPGYMINARWQIDGNQLFINCENFRAVLRRI